MGHGATVDHDAGPHPRSADATRARPSVYGPNVASDTGGPTESGPSAASSTGPFDPEAGLTDLSRQALAELGREYLLLGHLLDRVGMPLVVERFGGEAQLRLAIDEWMAASPVYSKRMQRALRFEGDDVATVFKNLQLDIGAPPQFMDFQFRLDGPEYGEFWLDHCGALMDVEPWGETAVRRMCHDIEDPTFDATAAATNPHMVMRPIHRPPRTPADRHPHCRWKVFVDEDATAADPHPDLDVVASSLVATVGLDLPEGDGRPDAGGLADYSGPFDARLPARGPLPSGPVGRDPGGRGAGPPAGALVPARRRPPLRTPRRRRPSAVASGPAPPPSMPIDCAGRSAWSTATTSTRWPASCNCTPTSCLAPTSTSAWR